MSNLIALRVAILSTLKLSATKLNAGWLEFLDVNPDNDSSTIEYYTCQIRETVVGKKEEGTPLKYRIFQAKLIIVTAKYLNFSRGTSTLGTELEAVPGWGKAEG